MKRAFDIVGSLVGLVALSPLLVAAAVAVKLGSGGPVFFLQERVGRNFRRFKIIKFRTMVVGADRRGAQITAGADPRVTPVGRLLRCSKIDELPQLFNVLAGHMSLVGPRPEVPRYVEMFRDDYRDILTVRPGITDLASIKFRDEAAVLGQSGDPEKLYVEHILPEKIALARQYIARSSIRHDLAIIFRTLLRIGR